LAIDYAAVENFPAFQQSEERDVPEAPAILSASDLVPDSASGP
jgi:hypothetical protein